MNIINLHFVLPSFKRPLKAQSSFFPSVYFLCTLIIDRDLHKCGQPMWRALLRVARDEQRGAYVFRLTDAIGAADALAVDDRIDAEERMQKEDAAGLSHIDTTGRLLNAQQEHAHLGVLLEGAQRQVDVGGRAAQQRVLDARALEQHSHVHEQPIELGEDERLVVEWHRLYLAQLRIVNRYCHLT
jgi:hypothetical protein